jgi:hypothetical protein
MRQARHDTTAGVMRRSLRLLQLIVVAAFAVSMEGCAVQNVSRLRPKAAQSQLVADDQILVALKSGKNYKGVVVSADENELVTRTGRYRWSDIDHITIKKIDWVGTTFEYVLLHVVVVGAAALYVKSWDE